MKINGTLQTHLAHYVSQYTLKFDGAYSSL